MNAEELFLKINNIKKAGKDYNTNSYLNANQWRELLDRDALNMMEWDGILVALIDDLNIYRVLYFTESLDKLKHIENLSRLNFDKPVILEILTRGKEINDPVDFLILCGYKKIRELKRMKCVNMKDVLLEEKKSSIRFAGIQDAADIVKLLYRIFDIRVSRLPNQADVVEDIQQGQIFISEKDSQITGIAYFRNEGKQRKYLYQLAVVEEERGNKTAYHLLKTAHDHFGDACRYTVWVESDNESAIHIYNKVGFQDESLKETIFEI